MQNEIPEFNDLIYRDLWIQACKNLHKTNNFPEITGRICPALCEEACTLNLQAEPVLIRHIERQIAEKGFQQGWITPQPAEKKTNRRVAVIGSGPAGLAAAQQLARRGHDVTVFEKDDAPGGLLRYGIPDFKLDKRILDRRLEQLRAEGVSFETSVEAGRDVSAKYLQTRFDAILLAMGATVPRDLDVPGRPLEGVHFAMEYLTQSNRRQGGRNIPSSAAIDAAGKHVVVIGGGDTGSDCIGTAIRQGAADVHQLEILPQPPQRGSAAEPWPQWPIVLRTSTSQQEGCQRKWSVCTRELTGTDGQVRQLHGCEVQWTRDETGRWEMSEQSGTEFTLQADLVLLAMGFLHVRGEGLVEQLGLKLDPRGNVVVDEFRQTSRPAVFAAGDTVRGASLVVWAIHEGRQTAEALHRFLSR